MNHRLDLFPGSQLSGEDHHPVRYFDPRQRELFPLHEIERPVPLVTVPFHTVRQRNDHRIDMAAVPHDPTANTVRGTGQIGQ